MVKLNYSKLIDSDSGKEKLEPLCEFRIASRASGRSKRNTPDSNYFSLESRVVKMEQGLYNSTLLLFRFLDANHTYKFEILKRKIFEKDPRM